MKRALMMMLGVLALGVLGAGCTLDTTYTRCIDSSDCVGGDQCFQINTTSTSGRMCSYTCGSDFDCESNLGFSGACYALLGDTTSICYQRCDFDTDCFSSSACIPVYDTTGTLIDAVCMPTR